jgi:hypothetical protein
MGSGAVIYVPTFINIGSGVQMLMGGGYTHRQQRDLISLLCFFKIRKVGYNVSIWKCNNNQSPRGNRRNTRNIDSQTMNGQSSREPTVTHKPFKVSSLFLL